MPATDEALLLAVLLDRPAASAAVRAAWDAGEAVAVLDPSAPPIQTDATLAAVRPTHVLDRHGRHRMRTGVPAPHGVAAVVATSGTTGTPKAVELTRAGLETMGHGVQSAIDGSADDRWLLCMPAHHVAGLAILARSYVTGATVVALDSFDVAAVAAAPRDQQTTLLSVVPTMLHRLLEAGAPLSEWRRVLVGGAPTPTRLWARAMEEGVALVDAYGQSETWGGCVLNGRPIAGVEAMLAPDDEILVRGPVVMRAYRGRPEETVEVLEPDGWLHTGDVGAWTDDGRLRVVDRRRDVVITGGVNVSPTEVEDLLSRHPAVADVGIAGAPDDEWGERVVAFVVPVDPTDPPTLDALREFARVHLAVAKLPRQVVIVETLPRSVSGKLRRRELPLPD